MNLSGFLLFLVSFNTKFRMMLSEVEKVEVDRMVDEKIKLGQELQARFEPFLHIEGATKIQKKIGRELKYLQKAKSSGKIQYNNVLCSNLPNYECLINTLYSCRNIKHLDYPIQIEDRDFPLRIDIICDNGSTWVKVIARNPKSLSDTAQGRSGFGTKTILDQAAEFVQAANDNQCFFRPPKVIFEFAHKIDDDLAAELEEIGVTISQYLSNSHKNVVDEETDEISQLENINNIEKLNLDVTTMLAYVSALTNGSNFQYNDKILAQQSALERSAPLKSMLDKIFEGKELISCETAFKSFEEICATVGGVNEKIRAAEFVKRITVLPDVPIPVELAKLNVSGQIKPRSLLVFSFGIAHKALTVTANKSFIRSAKMQGIDIPVFLHSARALSEQKEVNAFRTPARMVPKTPMSRQNSADSVTDPVQVYCRVRPINNPNEASCVEVISSKTVSLRPPEQAVNYKTMREMQYTFQHVFGAHSTQHEVYERVAQPLVEGLIKGKNGLLFTYGMTSSGKTYTMTGNQENRGIMPRCLESLFRTISDYQTKKYIFKPDRLNGFEILSEEDAMRERQIEMNARFGKTQRRKDSDPEITSQASAETSTLAGIDEDNMYVRHGPEQKTLQMKIIRNDNTNVMYVHGVNEVEVKTVSEAIDAYHLGQKRKRTGHTTLNAESSRSHSVFTIRLVQAPTDSRGEHLIQDRRKITISQLSLVDLAGSERTNRTNNTGVRLREAGNINNSLMTLRKCLEILRENQSANLQQKVPYRDAKITHLFKSYFDGEGQVFSFSQRKAI
ncbi:Kinesin-like protein KIF23 [Pseudolycoriella hygida]|uniref:Kinesin-like protein n=1 Tax=Pseudolycoriella hygida TaxID=35572 RepID=A0A9Q0MVZ1_9DIPT|nr:Kinesin-like protein KIF23 [Pseudolycoriella hygida]